MYQAYAAIRYRLTQQKVPRTTKEKWLLIAKLLDALEEDYRRIYPNDAPPFEDGYTEVLKRLIE